MFMSKLGKTSTNFSNHQNNVSKHSGCPWFNLLNQIKPTGKLNKNNNNYSFRYAIKTACATPREYAESFSQSCCVNWFFKNHFPPKMKTYCYYTATNNAAIAHKEILLDGVPPGKPKTITRRARRQRREMQIITVAGGSRLISLFK